MLVKDINYNPIMVVGEGLVFFALTYWFQQKVKIIIKLVSLSRKNIIKKAGLVQERGKNSLSGHLVFDFHS
jgi:hypothetical protein